MYDPYTDLHIYFLSVSVDVLLCITCTTRSPQCLVGPCCSSFQFSVLCVLVLFVFVLCLMPNVTSVSGLSILDFPFVLS